MMDSQLAPQTHSGLFTSLAKYLRLSSIRGRLGVALVAFAIFPVVVTGLFINLINLSFARDKVQDSLQAITALKGSLVRSWARDLQLNLSTGALQEAESLSILILRTDPGSGIFQRFYAQQVERFNQSVKTLKIYDELMLLDGNGIVVLSTSPEQVGKNLSDTHFFKQIMVGRAATNTTFDQGDIFVTKPLAVSQGVPLGVLVGRANVEQLYAILGSKTGLGSTGEAYLVGNDGLLLSPLSLADQDPGKFEIGKTRLQSEGIEKALSQQPGAGAYLNFNRVPVIGAFQWVPELQVAVLTEQHQAEAYQFLRTTQTLTILALIIASALAVLAGSFISNNFSKPLTELADTAKRIAAGNLELRAKVEESSATGQVEEITALAVSFNSMTAQLRNLIGSLENRIAERTRQLQARSEQLLTASEVGRYATSLLETEQLIQRTVDLIKERFDLYYVGLFTVDESGEWAVLKAGTGQAGQVMLQRVHRLFINRSSTFTEGQSSMIGWCIANNQARIALEALEDPMRLASPELPDTRSEAAIPLRSRGQVLGAMTIQSSIPGAFDKEMIAVFQNMADQVAVALDNARLFSQIQRALESAHQAYSEITREAWQEKLRSKPMILRRDSLGLSKSALVEGGKAGQRSVQTRFKAENKPDGDTLMIPIRARGQVIGYVNAQKRRPSPETPEEGSKAVGQAVIDKHSVKWRSDETKLLETLVDQMGIALDSARLFEETQLQARRERIISEITTRVRTTLDIHKILQSAAVELRAALGLASAEVHLGEGVRSATPTSAQTVNPSRQTPLEIGYLCTTSGEPVEVSEDWTPDMLQAISSEKVIQSGQRALSLPIKARNQAIGVIKLIKPDESEGWSRDEIDLVETLSDRLGSALESAQLYEETHRRAERERMTSEIIAKMRASNDPRTILQTAAFELKKALSLTDRAQIQPDNPLITQGGVTSNSEVADSCDPGEPPSNRNQPGDGGPTMDPATSNQKAETASAD